MSPPTSQHHVTHWVVPFASSLSEACLLALPQLDQANALPYWQTLTPQLAVTTRWSGDEYALSMPHERVLGSLLAWITPDQSDVDGLLPLSAWWAAQDGLQGKAQLDHALPWGLLNPGHWLMGREHLTLLDPDALQLTEPESRAFFDAILPLFDSDGWALRWGSTLRWYASHPSLAGLPTASLDRVIGRDPDMWLTHNPQGRMLRRLQSEVQMLLYQHPVNDTREAAGVPTINSFWLSGCGAQTVSTTLPAHVQCVDTLRAPMLSGDMASWIQAWQQLDATVFKEACAASAAGHNVQLTLCGERHALTLSKPAPSRVKPNLWQRIQQWRAESRALVPSAFLSEL